MNLLKLCAVTICITAVILIAAHSQQSSSSSTYGNQEGRYRLIVTTGAIGSSGVGSTPIDKQYVIDTQTGRVWRSAFDEKRKLVVFDAFIYENLDGELSRIPNDLGTVLTYKHPEQSDTNSTNH